MLDPRTTLFAPVREAQRMQFELYHGQESLLDDLPVLLPAQRLPGAHTDPHSPQPRVETGPSSAETTDGGTRLMAAPGIPLTEGTEPLVVVSGEERPLSALNNNGPARKPVRASAGGASQEKSR